MRVVIDGIDRTDMMERSLAVTRLAGLRNGIARRFDRCCHPGKPGDGVLLLRRLAREMSQ